MVSATTTTIIDTNLKPALGNGLVSNCSAVSPGSRAKRDRFLSVFPRIQAELVQHLDDNFMPEDAKAWFKRNLEYNVPGGKLNRGIAVIDTIEIIRGKGLDDNEYFEAAVLGWGVELLQSFFLVVDDIMDSSITRRDQPCWYRVTQPARVGTVAINDGLMLEGAIFHLLKLHFRRRPYYADLLDLFHDMTFATELGQLVDLITAPEDEVDLARFSLAKHRLIVVYKTAYYSFYLPVALAMMYTGVPILDELPTVANTISVCMSASKATNGHTNGHPVGHENGHTDRPSNGHASVERGCAKDKAPATEQYQLALDILLPLGEYFQVQDDYLDCFGADIGKIGTDILDNKCSWVICTALDLASPEQRAILDENYGRKDSACEARCKEIFEDLGLRARYTAYEEASYKRINALIDSVDETNGEVTIKKDIFRSFLQKIYRRQK